MSLFTQKKSVSFNESDIDIQKNCVPGPNVVFGKRDLPFFNYLENVKVEGSLGCGSGKYPKYEDGKYCCVDTPVTDQELLDYLNFLLEGAMKNVNETIFVKQANLIKYIIDKRKELKRINPTLVDTLDYSPYNDINDWFDSSLQRSRNIPKYRPNPTGGKKRTTRKKYNKSKKNKKFGKSRKNRRYKK